MRKLVNLFIERPNSWYDNLNQIPRGLVFLCVLLFIIFMQHTTFLLGKEYNHIAVSMFVVFYRLTYFILDDIRKFREND